MALRTNNKKNHNFFKNQGRKKSIFAAINDDYDITPKVLEVKNYKTSTGKSDQLLTLKVFSLVDVDNINRSSTDKINLSLTKNSIQRLKSNAKSNVFKTIASKSIKNNNKTKSNLASLSFKKQVVPKSTKKLLSLNVNSGKGKGVSSLSLKPVVFTSLLSNQSIVSLKKSFNPLTSNPNNTSKNQKDNIYLTSFDIKKVAVKNQRSLFSPLQIGLGIKKDKKKIVEVQINDSNPATNTFIENKLENFQESFKGTYNNLIQKSIDPIILFERPYKKSSYIKKRSSYIDVAKFNYGNYYNQYENFFKSIFDIINEKETNIYKKNIVLKEQSLKVLESVITISKNELVSYGPNLKFVYIAKDINGLNLESYNISFNIESILQQLKKSSLKYDVSSCRKINGETTVTIGNKSKNSNLNLTVYLKTFRSLADFKSNYFKDVFRNITIPAKQSSVYRNANFLTKRNKNIKLIKYDENAFYRSTINFSNEEFDNVVSTSIKSSKNSKSNFPDLAISVVNKDDHSEINVQNISNNVTHILVRKKQIYEGRTSGIEKKIYTSNLNLLTRQELNYLKIEKNQSIKINDFNVLDDNIYKYYVDCIMKNGERVTANKSFIYRHETRSNFVSISNLATQLISENTIVSEEAQTRKVKNAFFVRKIETEVDKIYASLFGEIFNLFESELKEIKDIQSFSYSVLIERINRKTGENIKVGTFKLENDGLCEFTDNIPIDQDVTYVVRPRVALTADLVASINNLVNRIGKKQGNSKLNFSFASARKRSKNISKKRISSTGSKFNSFSFSRKGRITTNESKINESNLDFFSDRSTGDVFTFDIPKNTNTENSFSLDITLDDIREIKNLSTDVLQSKENHRDINIASKRYYNLSFSINTSDSLFVDFFAIFIHEDSKTYLDGVAHVKDQPSNITRTKYLVKHEGSVGVVSYYALPVLKDGTFLEPTIIGRNIIE